MKRRQYIPVLMFILLLHSVAAAQDTMLISTFLERDTGVIVAEEVIREAYKRLGIEVEIQHLPGKRALVHANDGKTDGELYRIRGLSDTYPNLLMVSIPVSTTEIVVFTKETHFAVTGWESLSPYTIGILRGVPLLQEPTQGMNVELVTTLEQNFKKLDTGRVDIIVEDRLAGLFSIQSMQLKGINILEPPLEVVPLYHYIHKKHQSLLPRLEEVFRQMKKEQFMQRVKNH